MAEQPAPKPSSNLPTPSVPGSDDPSRPLLTKEEINTLFDQVFEGVPGYIPSKQGNTPSMISSEERAPKVVKQYIVIFERGKEGEENWGAYAPDLPGCVSTGDTLEEVKANIKEAIELHLEGLKAEGLPIPEPTIQTGTVSVAA